MLQYLSYIFFRIFMFFVSVWPTKFVYVFSDWIKFLLEHVIKYRRKVIIRNLEFCFSDMNDTQKGEIISDYYQNISDIIVEMINGFTMPIEVLNKRYIYKNASIVNKETHKGKSVIVAGGHIANWEWGVSTIGHPFDANVHGIYKPVQNIYISQYIDNKRKRSGMLLCPISETRLAFKDHHSDGSIFLMLGDQNASNKKRAHWVDFLNVKTACLHGIGHYAQKLDLKVFYLDVIRTKRGYYEATLKLICDNPTQKTPEEITALYMLAVENNIKKNIGNWLWTHKRWKNSSLGHSIY